MQSIEKACNILELLSTGEPLSATQIAERENLPVPTAYRMLNILTKRGLVEKDARTKRYSIGWSIIKFAKSARKGSEQQFIIESLRPCLAAAMEEVGETTTLAAFTGSRVVLVDIVEATNSLHYSAQVGKEMPWNASGPGKLFFAFQPDPKLRTRILQNMDFSRYTENTICDVDAYLTQIAQIRRTGLAYCEREMDDYCTAVSVPVFDSAGHMIYALSTIGQCDAIRGRVDFIGKTLRVHADKAGAILRENFGL